MKQKLTVGIVAIATALVAIALTQSRLSQRGTPWLPNLFPSAVERESHKKLLGEVWQTVNRRYIDTSFNGQDWNAVRQQYLSRSYMSQEEVYKAIKDMLKLLNDPLTRFLDPAEFEKLQLQTPEESTGIGLELILDKTTKELVVANPIEYTTAYTAGILPGDVIVKIDGQIIEEVDTYEATSHIQGSAGTAVNLVVRRGQNNLEFKIIRERIELRSVRYRSQKTSIGDIGYVRLVKFNVNAASELRQAIQNLEQQQVIGYILDLRTNPGGILFSIVDITRMWLQEGTIFTMVERQGMVKREQGNRRAITNKPLIVLVNEATASGTEILASALQDNKRAILVGSQTAGYNSIQSVRGLGDGSGLAVTIAKWLTPKGRDINNSGITPDVVANLTQAQQHEMIRQRSAGTTADPQYAKALEVLTQSIQKKLVKPKR